MRLSRIFNIVLLLTFGFSKPGQSQNTVGVLINSKNALEGYTLFTAKTETYLINNCGGVVKQWTSSYLPGQSVYLLENGNLLRAAEIPNPGNINIPGIGGRIELFDWDGQLIWEYNYSTMSATQHHDVFPLPDGNILMLAVTIISRDEAIQMGRKPSTIPLNQLYNEQILELQPIGINEAKIIWEWNVKDHLIQDYDNKKDSYGDISENPQLLDINFLGISSAGSNWLHINAISYSAELDQIVLSSRHLHEIYMIDHSTSIAEAASHTGGRYGKGGDLLYRWGNPITYQQGSVADQKLFAQHSAGWISEGLRDAGKILLFNNGLNRSPLFSEIDIIEPPVSAAGEYIFEDNVAYGPPEPAYVYTTPIRTDFYSPFLSSAQRLANGNLLICEGRKGHFFEIDQQENMVWKYISPVSSSGILNQGENPENSNNHVFRATKYATDYQAFTGKDLVANLPVEGNPDLTACNLISKKIDFDFKDFIIYPNPVSDDLKIKTSHQVDRIELFDLGGNKVYFGQELQNIDLSRFHEGVYFLRLTLSGATITTRIMKFNF
ncbi:MAG: aryl-sulfate sulfotransferase [Saprospiraceae bacterium]|nr:aryl-sulfate sulfotransferase [Saprospiraceae bacterium]